MRLLASTRGRWAALAAGAVACSVVVATLHFLGRAPPAAGGAPLGGVLSPPGMKECRAWLSRYREEQQARLQQDPEAGPRWPEAISLPACNSTAASAASDGGSQRSVGSSRHLVLATVGDHWGLNATKNR